MALSLPDLWSSISVEVNEGSNVQKMVEGIGPWLGRSGVWPLAISLRMGHGHWKMNPDPILDLFISFIGRWEDVQLDLVGPFDSSISSIHLLQAPLLKRFGVTFGFRTYEVVEPLFSMLSASPHLTDLVWYNNDCGVYHMSDSESLFDIAELTIPWSQLTRFKMGDTLQVNECLNVLHQCPNLIDCTFESVPYVRPTWLPIPLDVSVVHQHLCALTLGSQQYKLFDYLTLPALCTFALGGWDCDDEDWPQDSFTAFLLRSGCSLKTIKLRTTEVSGDQLMELLGLLPTLTELSIKGIGTHALGDALFHNLTYDGTAEEPCLCPELEAITLGGSIASSKGVLARMIESRYCVDTSQSQIVCLQRVTIMLGYEKEWEEYLIELEVMRNKGLSVVVEQEIYKGWLH